MDPSPTPPPPPPSPPLPLRRPTLGPPVPLAARAREPLRWGHALAVVLVCVGVYATYLGTRSFASSEGHRVVPAWEMLDRAAAGEPGALWRVTMFGQAYLRKPPGMPWAIAAAATVLGRSEWSARSVSAASSTLAAVAGWWFASRWFGARRGVVAGLALALMPQLWAPGRTAEIEALNDLGTLLGCFAVLDGVLAAGRGRLDRALVIAAGALGVCIAVLAKGPACGAALAGALVAPAVLRRATWRAYLGNLAIAAASAAVLVPIGRRVLAAGADSGAITQGADEFVLARGVVAAVMLPPMALFAALPASLALMFPWGRDARSEAVSGGAEAERALVAARVLGVAWIVAIVLTAPLGNPRYALPASCFLAPMACYVVGGAWGARAFFEPKRRRLAARLMLGNPLAVPVLLAVAALLGNAAAQRFRIGTDGRDAGRGLARVVARSGGASPVVDAWADGLAEARPDVLLYAQRAPLGEGWTRVRPLWKKREVGAGVLPPAGTLLVLRVDDGNDERARYERAIVDGVLVSLGDGEVGRYRFRVFRSAGPTR